MHFQLYGNSCTVLPYKIWSDKYNLKELEWPAQSPDLSSTEHLWDELECQFWVRSSPTSVIINLTPYILTNILLLDLRAMLTTPMVHISSTHLFGGSTQIICQGNFVHHT